jgi:hypothetical protein
MSFLTIEYSPWHIGVSWDRTTTIPELEAGDEMEAAKRSMEGGRGTGSVNRWMSGLLQDRGGYSSIVDIFNRRYSGTAI